MVFSQRAGCVREFVALLKHLQPSPPSQTPAVEVSVCAECSNVFSRERTGGRNPVRCPECRSRDRHTGGSGIARPHGTARPAPGANLRSRTHGPTTVRARRNQRRHPAIAVHCGAQVRGVREPANVTGHAPDISPRTHPVETTAIPLWRNPGACSRCGSTVGPVGDDHLEPDAAAGGS